MNSALITKALSLPCVVNVAPQQPLNVSSERPLKIVLLAEEDEIERQKMADLFREHRYRVIEVEDGFELVDYLAQAFLKSGAFPKPDAIVSDDTLSGWNGYQVCERLRTVDPSVPFVLLTRHWDFQTWEKGRTAGASFLFEKPLDWDKLIETLGLVTRKKFDATPSHIV